MVKDIRRQHEGESLLSDISYLQQQQQQQKQYRESYLVYLVTGKDSS